MKVTREVTCCMYQYKLIKEQLIVLIGKMEVGERLPSRTALCRSLCTTRTTLDRAIAELVLEGVLSSKKGSGTYSTGLLDGKMPYMENWGVIVPSADVDVFPDLIQSIRAFADDHGINTIVCDTQSDAETQERFIKRLLASGVSGFIIVPIVSKTAAMSARLYRALLQSNIPFVFCNREVEGIDVPTVKSTDFYGGYVATKHLIEQGYRRIAYIATQKYQTSMERCQGYINALIEQGMEIDRARIYLPLDPTPDCYYQKALEMLQSKNPPDAIFCFNDGVAEEVYRAIKDCGLRVSADVGVLGYDNTKKAEVLSPPLTSMDYQSEAIGKMAAELLWKLTEGIPCASDFQSYLFQPTLIKRQSCTHSV